MTFDEMETYRQRIASASDRSSLLAIIGELKERFPGDMAAQEVASEAAFLLGTRDFAQQEHKASG
jgi:hypothetical protein